MFNVGDIVKYKTRFLQDIEWYYNVPKNGKVLGPGALRNTVLVHWCDREEHTLVNVHNLVLEHTLETPR